MFHRVTWGRHGAKLGTTHKHTTHTLPHTDMRALMRLYYLNLRHTTQHWLPSASHLRQSMAPTLRSGRGPGHLEGTHSYLFPAVRNTWRRVEWRWACASPRRISALLMHTKRNPPKASKALSSPYNTSPTAANGRAPLSEHMPPTRRRYALDRLPGCQRRGETRESRGPAASVTAGSRGERGAMCRG